MRRPLEPIQRVRARGLRPMLFVCVATGLLGTGTAGQLPASAAEVEARVSPEAVFFNGNEPLRGRDAIARAWAPFFEGPAAPFSWHPDLVQVLESGRLALTSGPVRDATGTEVGRFNSIWRRDPDGHWRVVFDKGS